MADALLLDSGLDAICTLNTGSNGPNYPPGYQPYEYLAVGTGSSAPATTQTALDAETHRSNATGGFPQSTTHNLEGGNKLVTTVHLKRIIDFTASYSLTEYGFVPTSTGGPFSVRELFRDGSNNPITIGVQNGQQLQVELEIEYEMPFAAAADSFTITGIGTVSGQATVFATSSNFYDKIFRTLMPYTTSLGKLTRIDASGQSTSATASVSTDHNNAPAFAFDAYTNGNFYRTRTATFGTAAGNGTFYGMVVEEVPSSSGAFSGYKNVFDAGQEFVKASTHELTIVFKVSVARAP